jgi:hypothetical protein
MTDVEAAVAAMLVRAADDLERISAEPKKVQLLLALIASAAAQ